MAWVRPHGFVLTYQYIRVECAMFAFKIVDALATLCFMHHRTYDQVTVISGTFAQN